MTLRLIRPSPGGPSPRPPRGRPSAALSLTHEEVRHLRAATRNAVRAYGNSAALAEVIGVPVTMVHKVTSEKGLRPCAAFAIRLARAAGMSVETILTGQLSAAGRCEACGARIGHVADRRAS